MSEGARTVRTLQVTRPGVAEWVDVEVPAVPPGWFRVDTVYSGVSAGTELTFLKGTNPYLAREWDAELGMFHATAQAPYPVRKLGYMEVGRVVASRTPHVAVGDLLAMAYGHASGHDADPMRDRFTPLPAGLDPILGIYVAQMGPICANGLLHAAADLLGPAVRDLYDGVRGRRVLVIGAGVVGLLTAVFANHGGAAEVVVADRTAARLRVAAGLGLGTVDTAEHELGLWCKQRWRHGPADRGADVVLQCRGQSFALNEGLQALRPQGTVVDLAFYPGAADEVQLGEEFHHNGLRIVCAQINRVPRGLAHAWDRERLSAETLAMLSARGDGVRAQLVTDVVPAEEAPAVFDDLLHRRRHSLQLVLSGPAT